MRYEVNFIAAFSKTLLLNLSNFIQLGTVASSLRLQRAPDPSCTDSLQLKAEKRNQGRKVEERHGGILGEEETAGGARAKVDSGKTYPHRDMRTLGGDVCPDLVMAETLKKDHRS